MTPHGGDGPGAVVGAVAREAELPDQSMSPP